MHWRFFSCSKLLLKYLAILNFPPVFLSIKYLCCSFMMLFLVSWVVSWLLVNIFLAAQFYPIRPAACLLLFKADLQQQEVQGCKLEITVFWMVKSDRYEGCKTGHFGIVAFHVFCHQVIRNGVELNNTTPCLGVCRRRKIQYFRTDINNLVSRSIL